VAYLLGRTVIIEAVFTLPGLGTSTLKAINLRDYPQIQGNLLFIAFMFLIINIVVDIAPLGRAVRLLRRKPLGALSLVLIAFTVAVAILAPAVAPHSPHESFQGHRLEYPSSQFLMGTDQFARDILSRVIYGAQVSLLVGLASVVVGILGGSLLGLVSGYLEGRLDLILQRVMDGFMALPSIILALAFVAAIGPGLLNVMVAIGLSYIPRVNRVVRGSVLAEKQNVYIEAARTVGCRQLRIMARHLLPNVTAPIIVVASVTIANAILAEAALSFLGVGVPPQTASWGAMLSAEARRFMLAQPWLAIWPGLAITVTVLAWNLLGDAIRDVWDPRLRGS